MFVGQYELLERIGMGGMAEVFLARQRGEEGFERLVAIKRILPGVSADESFVAMFIDEAKIAVQLSHPNIASIYDLGRDDDVYYIAQEYVPGKDMGALIERLQPHRLPVDFVVTVGMRICEALQHAHEATGPGGRPLNIIHRDISPSNILISYEGAVKVIDFGLAKAAGRISTTQVGVVKGKLAYLSSEQARGLTIDHRSDLFSLGTCLFEWLTGQRLFLRQGDIETVTAVQRAQVPPLRAINPEVPPGLQAIVLRALQPDPNYRFQNAGEMYEALLTFAYEHRMVMKRRAIGELVRHLFPEASRAQAAPGATGPDTAAPPARAKKKRDTIPSAPYDLLDAIEEDVDPLEEMDTGVRVPAFVDEAYPADDDFDDSTGDFRREALRMAASPEARGAEDIEPPTAPKLRASAAAFDDTTAEGRRAAGFEDITSPTAGSSVPLDDLLAEALATKPKIPLPPAKAPFDDDFEDQTIVSPFDDDDPFG